MEGNFDFNQVGKRMPYHVPEGFFDKMEDDLWQELKTRPAAKRHTLRRIIVATLSAAAVAVLVFTLTRSRQVDYQDVEQAFCDLSMDDQAYLLTVYQDDLFLHE